MLAITETAAEAIKTLVTSNDMPEGSGARIAADGGQEGLELTLATEAGPADAVVQGGGAVVFLEQGAADLLDDKVLDVQRVTENGEDQVQFAIGQQPGMDGAAPA